MMSLEIIQAKPNPAGKESVKDQDGFEMRRREALFGEWIDVKNVGDEEIRFQTMQLRHALFDDECHTTGEMELYWIGDNNDLLQPGQILRVHAGRREDAHLMAPEDQAGADWHGYAESDNFILNNRCGDKIVLSWQDADERIKQDWACYAPNPPEGLILKRHGNLLAATGIGEED